MVPTKGRSTFVGYKSGSPRGSEATSWGDKAEGEGLEPPSPGQGAADFKSAALPVTLTLRIATQSSGLSSA